MGRIRMGRMGGVLLCLVQYQANIHNRKQSRRTSFIGVEENFVFDAMETWGARKRTLSLSYRRQCRHGSPSHNESDAAASTFSITAAQNNGHLVLSRSRILALILLVFF
jgi:hypothetical protein